MVNAYEVRSFTDFFLVIVDVAGRLHYVHFFMPETPVISGTRTHGPEIRPHNPHEMSWLLENRTDLAARDGTNCSKQGTGITWH